MKLYELTGAYKQLDAMIEADGGDDAALLAMFDQIEDALKVKATNIAMLVQNLEAMSAAIRKAELRMQERRKAIDSRISHIRDYLLRNMVAAQISLIECPEFRLAIRNNPPAVIVDDEAAIPAEYMRQLPQPAPVPDKKKIMDDIKQGVVIDGVHIEQGKSLTIK